MSSFYIVPRVKNFHYINIKHLYQLFRIKNFKIMADETDGKIEWGSYACPK